MKSWVNGKETFNKMLVMSNLEKSKQANLNVRKLIITVTPCIIIIVPLLYNNVYY